ncbi:MAG: hypothetical protein ACYDDR_10885 [Acidithiobacillus ferrivorans]
MFGEIFSTTLIQAIVIAIFSAMITAIGLFTWQRKDREYQIRKQTEDWKHRQTYSRREARRQAMENLLVELNEVIEKHLSTTELLFSAIARSKMDQVAVNNKIRKERWEKLITDGTNEFHISERQWLVDRAVISGKLNLYFKSSSNIHVWDEIIAEVQNFCTLLNENALDQIFRIIQGVRQRKDVLLSQFENEIVIFTESDLDVGY